MYSVDSAVSVAAMNAFNSACVRRSCTDRSAMPDEALDFFDAEKSRPKVPGFACRHIRLAIRREQQKRAVSFHVGENQTNPIGRTCNEGTRFVAAKSNPYSGNQLELCP